MSADAQRKDHPFSMRMPINDLGVIDRAASLKGRSRSEFIRDAAVRAAEEVILDQSFIRMSPAGFDAFISVLDAPAIRIPEMVDLADRQVPWDVAPAKVLKR